jgi:uncharacterized protein YjbI with pentapeptide repeats
MDAKELRDTIEKHGAWLRGEDGGVCADLQDADLQSADLQDADLRGADLQSANLQGADLRGADLQSANLRGADLRGADLRGADLRGADFLGADLRGADLRGADFLGANLDFSCFPLWCGSFDIHVDIKLARQLSYHLCRLKCDDPEFSAVRAALLETANKFHRVEECGRIVVE